MDTTTCNDGHNHLLLLLIGGTVAECSQALHLREEINENQKIPGLLPGLGNH